MPRSDIPFIQRLCGDQVEIHRSRKRLGVPDKRTGRITKKRSWQNALECRIGTVNVHLRNCAAKAGVPNRVALQAYMYQHPAVWKRHGHAPRGLDHHPEGCTC
jgi:hypothetical protein